MQQLENIAQKGKLSLGIVFPIESYSGSIAKMENQETLAKRAEELGFKALWFRDVPFHDPTFGDAGQLYDPWVYMTHIMNHTHEIALATGSIILPLRHPAHTVKSLLSLQNLSNGRVIMGVASGDRPLEYPAFNRDINLKAELFRDSFFYVQSLHKEFPIHSSEFYGQIHGHIDLIPKFKHKTSMLVTGHSGQSIDWISEHGDGWLYYPRNFNVLQRIMGDWQHALDKMEQPWKPFMQSLYIDLLKDNSKHPTGIHLGIKAGPDYINEHLNVLQKHGVNHVIINLKYGSRPANDVLEELGEFVVPNFT